MYVTLWFPLAAVANSLPPETEKGMVALAIAKRDDDDASTASSCSGQGKGIRIHQRSFIG